MRLSPKTPFAARGPVVRCGRRSPPRRVLPALVAGGLLVATGAGCIELNELDSVGRVHDTRVLAMRLDPPEVEVPLSPNEPPIEVTATVLIAAPEGEAVVYELRGCPSPGSDACEGRAPDDPEKAELYAPLTDVDAGSAEVGAVPEARPAVTRALPAELLVDLMTSNGLAALAGARPAFEVTATAGDVTEVAFKRLQVSFPDFAYRLALSEAGIEICDDQGRPEGCLPYETRVANRNPTFAGLRVARAPFDEADDGEPVPEAELGALVVAPGEEIRLDPATAPGDAEPYQTVTLDFDTEEVGLEDRVEKLGFTWYATHGSFSRRRTEEERTLGTENYYTAPTEVPAGGLTAWLWIVLQDTRGGVDFRTVRVDVVP